MSREALLALVDALCGVDAVAVGAVKRIGHHVTAPGHIMLAVFKFVIACIVALGAANACCGMHVIVDGGGFLNALAVVIGQFIGLGNIVSAVFEGFDMVPSGKTPCRRNSHGSGCRLGRYIVAHRLSIGK